MTVPAMVVTGLRIPVFDILMIVVCSTPWLIRAAFTPQIAALSVARDFTHR